MTTITVVIVTKDRAGALETISLPSLLKQGGGFDVLVWDASDDDQSKVVAEAFAPRFAEAGVSFRYVKAPRVGMTSQRNDAIKAVSTDVVFFIDDDSEVGAGGVKALADAFDSHPWLKGAALPLIEIFGGGGLTDKNVQLMSQRLTFKKIFLSLIRRLQGGSDPSRRTVNKTGTRMFPRIDTPAPAEFMSGCDMAFRRSVFDELQFEEELQRFSNYAWSEDIDLTHRVFLHYKLPLLVIPGPVVIHLPTNSGRGRVADQSKGSNARLIDSSRGFAVQFYNGWILHRNFSRYVRYSTFTKDLMMMLVAIKNRRLKNCIEGYKMYKKARKEIEMTESMTLEQNRTEQNT